MMNVKMGDVGLLVAATLEQTVAPGLGRVDDAIRAADDGLELATAAAASGSSRDAARVLSFGSEGWEIAFQSRESLLRANTAGIGIDHLARANEHFSIIKELRSAGLSDADAVRAAATHFAAAGDAARAARAAVSDAIAGATFRLLNN